MSGKAFFMLRGVDSALWTAARQQAASEGIKITDLVETLLSAYLSCRIMNDDIQTQAKRALSAKG